MSTRFLPLLFIYTHLCNAEPIAQRIYEDQIKRRCDKVAVTEIEQLEQCSGERRHPTIEDLEDTADYLVFKSIAKKELAQLNCMIQDMSHIQKQPELRKLLVSQACSKIEDLAKVKSYEKPTRNWVESHEKTNDPWMRSIPEDEYKNVSSALTTKKKQLKLLEEWQNTLFHTDSILSLPSVQKFVTDELAGSTFSNPKSPDQVCALLSKKLDSFFIEDKNELVKAKNYIEEKTGQKDWYKDNDFKRDLWQSAARREFVKGLEGIDSLKKSTLCRMEGRYGIGADTKDALSNLGILALGGAASALGRMAVVGASGLRSEAALAATRVAFGFDVGANAMLAGKGVIDACKQKINVLTDQSACTNSDYSFRLRNQVNECAYSASLALLSGGMATTGLRGLADAQRLRQAEKSIGRALNENEKAAIIKAHLVGENENGLNGGPASIENYTPNQIMRKARILKDAGIDENERRLLMEAGVVGRHPVPPEISPPKDFRPLITKEELKKRLLESQADKAEVYIARGGEARIYAVIEKTPDGDQIKISKRFHVETYYAKSEAQSMQTLKGLQESGKLKFNVAKIYGRSGKNVDLEFVEGLDMEQVMQLAKTNPTPQLNRIIKKFNTQVKQSVVQLKKDKSWEMIQDQEEDGYAIFSGPDAAISFAPRNFIVNPKTEEITMIDSA